MNTNEDKILETYLNELINVKKIVDYNTSGFEMTRVLYDDKLKKTITEFSLSYEAFENKFLYLF